MSNKRHTHTQLTSFGSAFISIKFTSSRISACFTPISTSSITAMEPSSFISTSTSTSILLTTHASSDDFACDSPDEPGRMYRESVLLCKTNVMHIKFTYAFVLDRNFEIVILWIQEEIVQSQPLMSAALTSLNPEVTWSDHYTFKNAWLLSSSL